MVARYVLPLTGPTQAPPRFLKASTLHKDIAHVFHTKFAKRTPWHHQRTFPFPNAMRIRLFRPGEQINLPTWVTERRDPPLVWFPS